MKLELKNIGLFTKAFIEIDGITVIAGENATGKSTIGKALYSMFRGFKSFDKQIERMIKDNIEKSIEQYPHIGYFYNEDFNLLTNEMVEKIYLNRSEYLDNQKDLYNELTNYYKKVADMKTKDSLFSIDSNMVSEVFPKIINTLKISDETILLSILRGAFNNEFYSETVNKNSDGNGKVSVTIKNENTDVVFSNFTVDKYINPKILTKDIVYIDDPYVLDDLNDISYSRFLRRGSDPNHRNILIDKLSIQNSDRIEKIKVDEKLSSIFNTLDGINIGDLVYQDNTYKYKDHNSGVSLDIRNVATGLKAFVIIKRLLENGTLEENGIIILDEPEIHLHPKWQVALAELIVLIQKEFNMHILLNTHSPYFLRAIEVFTEKHDIKNRTKFYLSYLKNESSNIKDVTENTEAIYKLLVDPLDKLEEELDDEY